MANPIIGPPEIIFAGSCLNPSPSATRSAWLQPIRTLTLTGVLNASPVSVITLVIRGVCLQTALYIAITVDILSTIHPASAGSFAE